MGFTSKILRVAALAIVASHAFGQSRHYRALVFGNETYAAKALPWAGEGGREVAKRLGELGFDVSGKANATARDMTDAAARFRREIEPGDVVVFYYAGRATRAGSTAKLVPVDDTDPKRDLAVDLRGMITAVGAGRPAATVIVLDVLAEQPVFGFDISSQWLPLVPAPGTHTAILASTRGGQGNISLTGEFLSAMRQSNSLGGIVAQVKKKLEAGPPISERFAGVLGHLAVRDRVVGVVPAGIKVGVGSAQVPAAAEAQQPQAAQDQQPAEPEPAEPAAAAPAPAPAENPPAANPPAGNPRAANPPASNPRTVNPPVRPAAPANPPANPSAGALIRFPAIDAPETVAVGTPFVVLVSLTTEKVTPAVSVPTTGKGIAKTAEGGILLNVPCRGKCDLEVVFSAPGFDFTGGANRAGIEMTADGDSTPARFELSALLEGTGRLEATFWYKGAFLFRAIRTVQVTAEGPGKVIRSGVAPVEVP